MKKNINHLALAAISTLTIVGCMDLTSDPASDPDPDPDPARPPVTSDIAARIKAAAVTANQYHLKNVEFQQCIDAPNGQLNIVLRLADCDFSSSSQTWAFVVLPDPDPLRPTSYYLVNQRSGFCAEVNQGTSVPGERVDLWHCDGSDAERWDRFSSNFSGEVIRNVGSHLVLDTVGGSHSQLMQWFFELDNRAQAWVELL